MINVMRNYFSHPAKFPPETFFYLAVTFYQFMSVYFIFKKKKKHLQQTVQFFLLRLYWHEIDMDWGKTIHYSHSVLFIFGTSCRQLCYCRTEFPSKGLHSLQVNQT